MDVIKALRYFNSEDGPHISVRKLAVYCGINENTMFAYIKGRFKPPPDTAAQIQKGLQDMIKEMLTECPI